MKRTMKLLGILCVLAVVIAAVAMFASAETALPEKCQKCNQTVETWTKLSTVADDAASIAAGHYYYDYAEDSHAWTQYKEVTGTVCVYIPEGKTLTGPSRVFTVTSGALSLMGDGSVVGIGYTGSYDGGAIKVNGGTLNVLGGRVALELAEGKQVKNGGALYVAANATVTIDGGSVVGGTTTAAGGAIYVANKGIVNLVSGSIIGGNAGTSGGALYVVGTGGKLNVSGGHITMGTAKTAGPCAHVRGLLTLSGDAVIDQVRQAPNSGSPVSGTLKIVGTYSGTVKLAPAATVTADMLIGSVEDANLLHANITIINYGGKVQNLYPTISGTDLLTTDTAPTYTKEIYCQKHGQKEIFSPLTEKSAAETTLAAGHYYLDVLPDSDFWAQKTISEAVCIDLNGQTVQATSRLFSVSSSGILSIQGEGTVKGSGFGSGLGTAARGGGVFTGSGILNIYGGTYTAAKESYNVETPYNGGILYFSGGEVNIYGGSFECADVKGIGGSIFMGPNADLNLYGGSFGGESPAICAQGKVTLSGDAQIDRLELRYKSPGPAHGAQLTVDGTYSGSVTIRLHESIVNPDLTAGAVLGLATNNADIRHASISLLDSEEKAVSLFLVTEDGKLKLAEELPAPLTREGVCAVCGESVTWTSLTESFAGQEELKTGHYYLDFADVGVWAQKTVVGKVCLDLNGQTLSGTTRAFIVSAASTLNLLGEGTVMGRGRATSVSVEKRAGGVILVEQDATLNLYEGTLTGELVSGYKAGNGGVLNVAGTFNMYGGEVKDGYASNAAGNIFVTTTGTFNMMGGSVTGGTCSTAKSVACRGSMKISGDASANEVYLWPDSAGPDLSEMLTISGKYTGTLGLRLGAANRVAGKDIGTALQADLSEATLSVVSSELVPAALGPDIVLLGSSPVMTLNGGEIVASYTSLDEAIENYTDPAHRIVLFGDVENVVVSKDAYVDLNGYSITGTVSGEGKLYLMDSQTDDFTVADGNYGTVPVGANVAAITQESACTQDGYLMIEKEGTLSFHRVQVQVTSMSLRPSDVGLYFKCSYAGDEMVKAKVESFGVALNLKGDPIAEENLSATIATVTGKEEFSVGAVNTSTLVYGIMKDSKSEEKNAEHATMQIYGRAYIQFAGEQLVYGACQNRSLVEQLAGTTERVGIDAMWDGLEANQKFGVYDMYLKFKPIMDSWNITNIPAEAPADQAELAQMRADEVILQARRAKVVAKMRQMGDLYWRATEDVTYRISSTARWVDFYAGRVYRGMPYAYARSDEQTFLEFASEPDEKGIYNISGLTTDHLGNGSSLARIGNDCSGSVNFAWNQVGAAISGTQSSRYMIEANGYLKVGDYDYTPTDDGRVGISKEIVAANGQERMFAAYAKVQPGDALDTTAAAGGHVILVVGKKVVYNPDGSINGEKSYIHTLEQTPGPVSRGVETCSWNEELGEVVYTIYKEVYMPFDQVFSSGYLPITCQVLIDASPVEEAKVIDSVDPSEYNYENLLTGEFTTNRMVSSVTLTVTDENGEVFRVTGSGIRAKIKSYDLQNFLTENYEGHMVLRGALELDKLVVGNSYHCTVVVSLGSGEKITVRDFDFVATDADISTPDTPSVPGTGGEEDEEGDIEEPTDPADPNA